MLCGMGDRSAHEQRENMKNYVANQVLESTNCTAENSAYCCCALYGVVSFLHTLGLILVSVLKCVLLSCMHASQGRRNVEMHCDIKVYIVHERLSDLSEPASTNLQLGYKSSTTVVFHSNVPYQVPVSVFALVPG